VAIVQSLTITTASAMGDAGSMPAGGMDDDRGRGLRRDDDDEETTMPNICHNTLEITGPQADADELRTLVTTAESAFDFNAVLPQPKEIAESLRYSLAEQAWAVKYGDWPAVTGEFGPAKFRSRDEAIHAARESSVYKQAERSFDELADARQECVLKYGYPDWYEWNCANWGTKWPAVQSSWLSAKKAARRDCIHAVKFDTAWCPPIPLLLELSRRFPSLTLRNCYGDYSFFGFVTFQAGEVLAEKYEEVVPEEQPYLTHSNYLDDELTYIGDARAADKRGPAFQRSKWANPFAIGGRTPQEAARLYLRWVDGCEEAAAMVQPGNWFKPTIDDIRDELRGRSLLCLCTHSHERDGCHGGFLLCIANGSDPADFDDDEDDEDEQPAATASPAI
jgi:hypothetical protein